MIAKKCKCNVPSKCYFPIGPCGYDSASWTCLGNAASTFPSEFAYVLPNDLKQ